MNKPVEIIRGEFVTQAIIDRIEDVKKYFNWSFGYQEIEDYFLEFIEEAGVPADSSPSIIVDNAIVNGSYGLWSDFYKSEEEAREAYENGELMALLESKDGLLVIHNF